MRNLKVVRVGEGSTLIHGQRKNNIDEPWVTFEHAISNSTNVVIDNSVIEDVMELVKEKSDGYIKRKRGGDINIPDTVFTVKELALSSNMSPASAFIKLQEKITNGEVWFIGKQSAGKGKPSSYFSKDSNAVLPPLPEKPSLKNCGVRKKDVSLIIPDTSFTMKQISEDNKINIMLATAKVKEMLAEGTVKIVELGGFIKGKRGRNPSKFAKV